MAMPARKTSAGTRITPPMPMHPIIRPNKHPSGAIHTTSANGTNIYPPWRRCIIVFPLCCSALVFVVLRIRVKTHYFHEPRCSQKSLAGQEKGEERIGNTVEPFDEPGDDFRCNPKDAGLLAAGVVARRS